MERETQTSTTATPRPEDTGAKDPRDTTPRGNPPIDQEALEKGQEVLERVKPY